MAKSKAAAKADEAVAKARGKEKSQEEASGEPKAKGAPRARKWNYGITPDAKISVIVSEEKIPNLKGDLTGDLTAIGSGCTVAQYTEKGGSRHGLRVLSRKGIIQLASEAGVFPQTYVAPPPKPKKEKAAKASE